MTNEMLSLRMDHPDAITMTPLPHEAAKGEKAQHLLHGPIYTTGHFEALPHQVLNLAKGWILEVRTTGTTIEVFVVPRPGDPVPEVCT